jgi:anthranilate phosphoribosyltransferase
MDIQRFIEIIKTQTHLTRMESREVMQLLLSGSVADEEIIEFLALLRDKGEQANELVGFAEVMRAHAAETLNAAGVRIESVSHQEPLLDTCGTGGDGHGTFNVSTAAALVAGAAGVRVAKHGNRSISSRCGSADVLEALGVKVDLPLERIPQCLDEAGIVFLLAPRLHLAMKHVMSARRSLKTKSVFNLLGPLTNPLAATVQLVGVFEPARTVLMAEALRAVGTQRAYVVAGYDGMDEITVTGPTRVSIASSEWVRTSDVEPEEFGLKRYSLEQLRGGNADTNAQLLRSVLDGERGPYRDVVLANASAAITLAGKAQNFLEGAERAAQVIDSGAALATLGRLVEFTQRYHA